MKKTYINPQIKVIKIEAARMIAASTELGVSSTNYNGTTTVESRRGNSLWDDDEEY